MNTVTLHPTVSLSPHYPLMLALRCALRAAQRAWSLARRRQQRAAIDRAGLAQLHEMSEHQLADIGLSRCDLPWMSQRDQFAQLLDDLSAYHRHPGVRLPPADGRF